MIKVIYCKEGQPISDFKVSDAVDDMIEVYNTNRNTITQDIPIKTSSELYLSVFSLRVMEGKISADEVEFYCEDEKLEFDIYFGVSISKNHAMGFFAEVTEKAVVTGYKNMKRDRCYDI